MTDFDSFYKLLQRPTEEMHLNAGVGTLSEKYLHALLKHFYEPDEDYHEVGIDRFTADICRENEIVEIQTRSLDRLREKLEYYLSTGYKVTVVYPIPHIKWISWVDPETGEAGKKRRSPKLGSRYDCFAELYRIKYFLDWTNLSVHLVLIDVEELRNLDGYGESKKFRSTRLDRIPVSLCEIVKLERPKDYSKLLPEDLPQFFTANIYAKAAKISLSKARTGLNILSYLEVIKLCGKDGRKNLYTRA